MPQVTRRDALKQLGIAGAGLAITHRIAIGQSARVPVGTVAGGAAVLEVTSVSPRTVRLTIRPAGAPAIEVPFTGALAQDTFGTALTAEGTGATPLVRAGDLVVRVTATPPTLHVETAKGVVVQRLLLSETTGDVQFLLPKGPPLGLGEGGIGFDEKGTTDRMPNGQANSDADGYRLAIQGARAPVQWLVGTDGWGMFIHQPYGAFDFKSSVDTGKFTPRPDTALPL